MNLLTSDVLLGAQNHPADKSKAGLRTINACGSQGTERSSSRLSHTALWPMSSGRSPDAFLHVLKSVVYCVVLLAKDTGTRSLLRSTVMPS